MMIRKKLWTPKSPAIIARRGFVLGVAALYAQSALPVDARLAVNQMAGFAGGTSLLPVYEASGVTGFTAANSETVSNASYVHSAGVGSKDELWVFACIDSEHNDGLGAASVTSVTIQHSLATPTELVTAQVSTGFTQIASIWGAPVDKTKTQGDVTVTWDTEAETAIVGILTANKPTGWKLDAETFSNTATSVSSLTAPAGTFSAVDKGAVLAVAALGQLPSITNWTPGTLDLTQLHTLTHNFETTYGAASISGDSLSAGNYTIGVTASASVNRIALVGMSAFNL